MPVLEGGGAAGSDCTVLHVRFAFFFGGAVRVGGLGADQLMDSTGVRVAGEGGDASSANGLEDGEAGAVVEEEFVFAVEVDVFPGGCGACWQVAGPGVHPPVEGGVAQAGLGVAGESG